MTMAEWTDERVGEMFALGYARGRHDERERIMAALEELDVAWKPATHRSYAEAVQARTDEMTAHAEASGRRPWPGLDNIAPHRREAVKAWLLGTWDRPPEKPS